MKARGGVFLDDEAAHLRWRDRILAAWFGRFAEIALGLIGGSLLFAATGICCAPNIILPRGCCECTAYNSSRAKVTSTIPRLLSE